MIETDEEYKRWKEDQAEKKNKLWYEKSQDEYSKELNDFINKL